MSKAVRWGMALGVAALAVAGWGYTHMARAAAPVVHEVRMLDDGGRFRFEPAELNVRRGDLIRFVQAGTMPHNVEFVRNTAPAGVDLGDRWVGGYVMARGDAYEVRVDDAFADGTYDFICSPHAALGMKGRITVAGGTAGAVALTHGQHAGSAASPADMGDTSLPLVAGEQGAQVLPYEMDGEVKVFQMSVERIRWETREDKIVEAWTFNRMVPGPTIRVSEGDRVRIVVTNNLPEETTAHWHGLEVPNAMDGVPHISQDPIQPGESFSYEFEAKPSGTHLYHSHFNALHQEEHGLYGMFIVDPAREPAAMQADREEIMIVGDGPLGFVINGKEFPAITPIEVTRGERIRVRMANLGGLYHPMHLHGGHFTVVAKDGFPVANPQDMNTLSLAPGETYDVILQAEEPGTWLWHCHVLSHVTGPKDENGNPTHAGMIGVVQVE